MPGGAKDQSEDHIENFIKEYKLKHETLKKVAEYIESYCRQRLQQKTIMGNVTSRAKDPDRLRDKLYNRNKEKKEKQGGGYKSVEDIQSDIVDIIGVRITLYFPSQEPDVIEIFENLFKDPKLDVRPISDKLPLKAKTLLEMFATDKMLDRLDTTEYGYNYSKEKHTYRYGDYRAAHIRAIWPPTELGQKLQGELGSIPAKTEIQIQSLLMHAWSEVSHDLVYKTLNGEVSSEEHQLLDCLNGIGKLGEHILRRTKRTLDFRREDPNFGKDMAGADALHDEIDEGVRIIQIDWKGRDPNKLQSTLSTTVPEKSYAVGNVQDLFDFMKLAGMNHRATVEAGLEIWSQQKNPANPVVDSILDYMLHKDRLNAFSLSSDHPFLIEEHNTVFKKGIRSRDEIYEVLATILDFACRSILQEHPDDAQVSKFLAGYTSLMNELKLYDNAEPVLPEEPWPVRQKKLRDKDVIACLNDLVTSLNNAKETMYVYNLRIARIKAWKWHQRQKPGPAPPPQSGPVVPQKPSEPLPDDNEEKPRKPLLDRNLLQPTRSLIGDDKGKTRTPLVDRNLLGRPWR